MGKSGRKQKNRIAKKDRPTAAHSSTIVRSLTAVVGNAAISPMIFNPSGEPSFQHQEISPSSEPPTDLVSNEGPLPVDDITSAMASGFSFQEVSPIELDATGHPMFDAQAIILASDTTSNPSTTIANNDHVVTLNTHRGPKRNYKNKLPTTTTHPGVYVDRYNELWYIMSIYHKGQRCNAWGSYPTSELASIVRLKIENFLQGLSKKIEPDEAFKLAVQKSREFQKEYNIPESRIIETERAPYWAGDDHTGRMEIYFGIGYHSVYKYHKISCYGKETDKPKLLKKILYIAERMRSYIQVNSLNNGKYQNSTFSHDAKTKGLVRLRQKLEQQYDSLPQESDSLPEESESLPQESESLSNHIDFDIQEYIDQDLK